VTLDPSVVAALEAVTEVKLDEPLSRHTTMGVGGPADVYAVATNAVQIAGLLDVCRDAELPFFILGSGSNIVVSSATAVSVASRSKTRPSATPSRP
jgi:UDP-N-acetylmuramate dehydrogenase